MALILIGTIHRTPEGYWVLKSLLERVSPEIIAVEFSPYGLRFRMKRGRELLERKRELPLSVKAFLEPPYEYRASRDYGREKGVPVLLLDSSSLSRRFLKRTGEMLFVTNLKKISESSNPSWEEQVEREYKLARKLWDGGLNPLWFFRREKWDQRRERAIARRLRQLLGRYPRRRIVYIGGWRHMLPYPGSLFDLLSDLSAERLLLPPFPEKGLGKEEVFRGGDLDVAPVSLKERHLHPSSEEQPHIV